MEIEKTKGNVSLKNIKFGYSKDEPIINNLHTIFGMVLQDTWLFNGTIEENLAYGREGATHTEVVAAAKTPMHIIS